MHKELTEVVNSTVSHANHCRLVSPADHPKFTLTPHALTYGDGFQGSKKLRATLATFINRYFNPVLPVAAEQIAVTAGVTLAIELCAFAFGDPGDGFLLGQPYYASFVEDLQAKAG